MYQIDFQKPIHVHFIGIGGISMSGLAELLLSAVCDEHGVSDDGTHLRLVKRAGAAHGE